MRRTLFLGLIVMALVTVSGCNKYVVRDHAVYKTERDFTDKLVRQAAAGLETMRAGKCGCVEGAFKALDGGGATDAQCATTGEVLLLVNKTDRWAWHSAMALINAGWKPEEIKDLPEGFDPDKAPQISVGQLCEGSE
jgi:hypothetical protein